MRRVNRLRYRLAVAACFAAAGLADLGRADALGDVRPVTGFDLDRYLGLWREIALIPNWFQKDCAADTTATYGLAEDIEGITVLNSCLDEVGGRSMVEGRARFTGPSDEGALEVTFVSLLGFWLWPISGDYIILALDPEYRWVAIGHPSRDYGWILAREERLPHDELKVIATRFGETGYDTCRLLMSPRVVGDPRTPLCELR